jgi:hypothetical protein
MTGQEGTVLENGKVKKQKTENGRSRFVASCAKVSDITVRRKITEPSTKLWYTDNQEI